MECKSSAVENWINKIVCGDCLDVMKNIPDNSIDSVVTDPPYFLTNKGGSGFMNLTWDSVYDTIKLLWLNKEFVKFAEKFFINIPQGCFGEEAFTVQENVNIKELESVELKNVYIAEKLLKLEKVLQKDFAQALVITKQEVLDLLKGWCGNLIKENLFLNGEKNDVVFVVPLSLLKAESKNFVQENVMKKTKAQKWQEKIIHLTLTEGLKINALLEEATGNKSERLSINEIITLAKFAGNTVKEKKFNVIISESIEKQKIIPYLTLSLCVIFATQKQNKIPQFLIENFTYQWATECLRILKPGGYLLSFGGTRTYHRMTCAIEDAGFEIRNCICWLYASGFPKSRNVWKNDFQVEVEKQLRQQGVKGEIIWK